MKVRDCLVCLDCDEVYDGALDRCPGCGSCSAVRLSTWLAPLPTREDIDREVRAQSINRSLDTLLLRAGRMIMENPDYEEPVGMGA